MKMGYMGLSLVGQGGGTPAPFAVAISGLTNNEAIIGDHASISYTTDPVSATETVKWSNSANPADAATYGTGANPTDFTAGDEGRLYLHVSDTVGGEQVTITASALIRYARGTAPAVADDQSFTVGEAITEIDGSASGANLTFTYALSGAPAGVAINASTGAITGTPTEAATGDATVTATDQYGLEYTDTWTWDSTSLPVGTAPNVADGQVVVVFVPLDIDGSASGDGLTFTYTLTGVAGTMTIDANTGQITGTVFNLNSGFGDTATITATDQHGREFTDTFTWTREAAPVISGVPTISGTETQGETLTAAAASVTGLPSPSTTWQWERSGTSITGATSATYTLVADDVGETLTVVQTETNTHGSDTAESAATGAIVADWTPADLFASSEEGIWYDIHPDYLFQNSNGTGAVTVGDPVGYVTDRSGNGNHATQATSAARPVLRQSGALYYLEFDGVDDFLETASIDFSGSDEMSLFGAFEKASEADADILLEFSANFSQNDGSFYLVGNELSGTADWSSAARGDDNANPDQVAASDDAQPSKSVLSGLHDISADTSILRVNGAQVDEATGDKGVGNFGNYPLYIGARAGISIFFDGNMYGAVARGASSTSQEISDAETYMAGKSGVTL